MASVFGWLDADATQRQQMLEVVDLFREEGTVDDLGIGSIRDALSDKLFPGTSVLHTRLRYVLFIPWLLQRAAARRTPQEMSAELHNLELRLIGSLLAGGETQGVIGRRARSALKQLPSASYWAALGAWGIRDAETADAYFRREYDFRALSRRSAVPDDPEARDVPQSRGIDAHLPPCPGDLLQAIDFYLTAEEEQYLSDRIAAGTQGSFFAWLVRNPPADSPSADVGSPAFAWEVHNLVEAPLELRRDVDHARRFSVTVHGASLLYNLLLAERRRDDELVAGYTEALADWQDALEPARTAREWDRADWWISLHREAPQLRGATRDFVNGWLDLVSEDEDVASSTAARALVADREKRIKGGRARLLNQSALDRWSGASGTGRQTFRWPVARSHLVDLYTARENRAVAS
ncbi:DUF6361 family protein [Cellulosimicrobium sp. ES-005]|uniref:DUF6361 family protein n=1 Tax=Cellulosimicrobium sp. ES-005 TaxID=3163031 RepID=A0AAU8G1G0_9MICO